MILDQKRVTFKSYFTVHSTLNILTIKTSTNRTGGFVMISANWKWPSAREVQSSWCSSAFSASNVTFMCHALVAGLNSGLTKMNKPSHSFLSFREDLWNCKQGKNLSLNIERRGEDDFFLSHYSLLISIKICFHISYFHVFCHISIKRK